MLFSSFEFLSLFLPLTVVLYYNPLIKGRTFKNVLLLLASLFFYAWGESIFVFVMLLSIAVNYFLVIKTSQLKESKKQKQSKTLLTINVIWNVALLFVFKYLYFSITNLQSVTDFLGLGLHIPVVKFALPLGISFFTFQILSYVFDVWYGKCKPQRNILNLSLYIALFPQLVAGPIVRYDAIENQILNREESMRLFAKGFCRFVVGLSKKVLIADYIAIVCDNIFSSDFSQNSQGVMWIGAIAYALQIYYDFSGYSDMAIGLGMMFGFKFNENFNYPYAAQSITDFWRRWHISLSSWFRDYVYIPMGGSRCSKAQNLLNLLVVWALTGFWHGANWCFVLWGLFYFVLLVFERTFKLQNNDSKPLVVKLLYRAFMLVAVLVAWVLFRAENCELTKEYITAMFTKTEARPTEAIYYIKNTGVLMFAAVLLSFPIVPKIREMLESKPLIADICSCVTTTVLFAISIMACINSTYTPFIYFNF